MAGKQKSKRNAGKYNDAFAARINAYRQLRGLKEEEIGFGIQQSGSAGIRICRGEQTPYLDQIVALACLLQVSPSDLVDFAVNPLAIPATSLARAEIVECAAKLCEVVDTLKKIAP